MCFWEERRKRRRMERVKLHENVNVDDLYIGKSVWRVVSVEYKKRMRVSSNRKIVYV